MGDNKGRRCIAIRRFAIAHDARLNRVTMCRVNPGRVIGKLEWYWYVTGRCNFLVRNNRGRAAGRKVQQLHLNYIIWLQGQGLQAINRSRDTDRYYRGSLRHFLRGPAGKQAGIFFTGPVLPQVNHEVGAELAGENIVRQHQAQCHSNGQDKPLEVFIDHVRNTRIPAHSLKTAMKQLRWLLMLI